LCANSGLANTTDASEEYAHFATFDEDCASLGQACDSR
jgi:hypothetical protein